MGLDVGSSLAKQSHHLGVTSSMGDYHQGGGLTLSEIKRGDIHTALSDETSLTTHVTNNSPDNMEIIAAGIMQECYIYAREQIKNIISNIYRLGQQ